MIQKMAERCPGLECLELPIKRSQGDDQETAIYRAFGGFRRLEQLSLKLHVSLVDLPADGEEEENGIVTSINGQDVPIEDIRNFFINAAVDSSIALSIFHLVALNTNLQLLKLSCSFIFEPIIDGVEFHLIISWIGRSWAVEHDAEGRARARKLDEAKIMEFVDDLPYFESELSYEYYLRVWESIWPRKSLYWWEDWTSFPLSE
ncbi:hypothetical protein F4808DRAFT_471276 [Astrocystis sublimbata]|nr:hypothetical protein F4808DRAFT_471276 [Astrocystis sublimbata]